MTQQWPRREDKHNSPHHSVRPFPDVRQICIAGAYVKYLALDWLGPGLGSRSSRSSLHPSSGSAVGACAPDCCGAARIRHSILSEALCHRETTAAAHSTVQRLFEALTVRTVGVENRALGFSTTRLQMEFVSERGFGLSTERKCACLAALIQGALDAF